MINHRLLFLIIIVCMHSLILTGTSSAQQGIPGKKLLPSAIGPSVVESMEEIIERDRIIDDFKFTRERNNAQGIWIVPERKAATNALSGDKYAMNTWGDTRMGIRFPDYVDVHGAYFKGQGNRATWTTSLRVVGYRDGEMVRETDSFRDISGQPRWMEINLKNVNRIEIVSSPVAHGGGWFGMDDLTYSYSKDGQAHDANRIVVNFDDLPYKCVLTYTEYAGLTWEIGRGDFHEKEAVHPPQAPPSATARVERKLPSTRKPSESNATSPILLAKHQGIVRGAGSTMSYPPDTDGAIGPNHFVEIVNKSFAVFDKYTGEKLHQVKLNAFMPGASGDPRILFDQHSRRWIAIASDFSISATIYLAISLTEDPMGDWFNTGFHTAEGVDEGRWPDYPTLGVDANGIYISAYMVPEASTIWAIDKAPLMASTPSMGTITAWRDLPYEDAIQPVHTFGEAGGEYLMSTIENTCLRIRKVIPPLTSPLLEETGFVTTPASLMPYPAPAKGCNTPLDTLDIRLMMLLYRDGSLWTCHTVDIDGRAACRWYEIDAATAEIIQWGNVADEKLCYSFPSIMVNQSGSAVMGFTGSSEDHYPSCYFTGRMIDDPPGEMAEPEMYAEGTASYNLIDPYGRNRWGDYSFTSLDPEDEETIWTIQEYVHAQNKWGTYMASLAVREPALVMQLADALPEFQNPGIPYTARIKILNLLENYVPGSGKIFYRYDSGGFLEAPLISCSGVFESELPPTMPGDCPQFYFYAEGDGGSAMLFPKHAPDDLFTFDVYMKESLLDDDFESDQGWTVLNQNVEAGGWERADPEETTAQPGDDTTAAGACCYVTGSQGGFVGHHDLDGGPATLTSPVIDATTGDAQVDYRVWFYHSDYGTQQPLVIELSNDQGESWTPVRELTHAPEWTPDTFRIADYVTPTDSVQVRFTASDQPNDDIVEALIDDFQVRRYYYDPCLWADRYDFPLQEGCTVNFSLQAGADCAHRKYLLMGSMTGTLGGIAIPGGNHIPLEWDLFTDALLQNLGSPAFQNFMGNLDASGDGSATLTAPGPFDPALAGSNMYFAFVLKPLPGGAWDFVSNPMDITLVH